MDISNPLNEAAGAKPATPATAVRAALPAGVDPTGALVVRGEIYLPRKAAAQVCGLSVHTLECWKSRRVGPPMARIGRRVFYPLSGLENWMASQVVDHAAARKAA